MLPSLVAGDFVLASRYFWQPKVNDKVVVHLEKYGTIVKRIAQVLHSGDLRLEGSHPSSVSSHEIGIVPKSAILGRVIMVIPKR